MRSNFRSILPTTIGILLMIQGSLHATDIPLPTLKDKCPVCGMFVIGYQDWLAFVRLKNRQYAYFDGPKDMFTYYLNLRKYAPTIKTSDITEIVVKDYYSLKPLDARSAYFVLNSDVNGPMGNELIPFGQKSDAQEFMTDHKGKQMLRFNQITPAVLKSLE